VTDGRLARTAAAVFAVGLVASCGADRPDIATAAPLEGTPWEVDVSTVRVSGIEQVQPTLELAQGMASGFAGCNSYHGPYVVSGSNLRFGDLATTLILMACEPAGTAVEATYLSRLRKVTHFRLTGAGLDLQDANGARLLGFVPAKTSLAGTWTITGVLLASRSAFSSVSEPPPKATFSADGAVNGDTGCNTFQGPWKQGPDNAVTIGPLAATFKVCPSQDLSTQEAAILDAFDTAATADVTSRSASLFNAAGQRTMSLER
jgi:heat shock protein HslJ